jgi:hypothetical protein
MMLKHFIREVSSDLSRGSNLCKSLREMFRRKHRRNIRVMFPFIKHNPVIRLKRLKGITASLSE